jgi:hypothetical protein
MFDSNAMLELAHLSRDRYQRAGGGGAHKVYNSSKAYDEARGYREMTPFRRAAYEATVLWRQSVATAVADFKWAIRPDRPDVETLGMLPVNPFGGHVYGVANTF